MLARDQRNKGIRRLATNAGALPPGLCLLIALAVPAISQSAMATPTVTIEGGVDKAGRSYTWIVSHNHTSPIVYLQFPQDKANGLTAPAGWEGELERNKDNQHQSGFVIFKCADRSRAIARDHPTTFKLNLVWNGAARGVGDVIIRFADGTQTTASASIPIKEPASDRNVSLIGLGSFFAIFLCVQAIRKRKKNLRDASTSV